MWTPPVFAIVNSGYRSPLSTMLGAAYHAFVCERVAMSLVYFNAHSYHKASIF